MKLSRQVGSVSQILNVYVQDFNVTTGAGLANIFASNVSYSWFRNNQNGVSTAMAGSTGTLGTYSSGAWLQINSATALGWYQFGLPNDALLSGDAVGVHFYVSSGPLTMAPLPVEIELTKTNNQTYTSSQTIGFVLNGVNVTSFSAALTTNANVIQAYGSAIVTSASGQFRVSTQAIDKGGYGVTTIAANITSNANVVQWLGVAAVGGNGHVGVDWANVTNKASYNDLSSTFISTNQSIAGASAPTAAQVAQAVWDEIATSHSASSSFAVVLKNGMVNVSTLVNSGVNISTGGLAFAGVSSDAWPLWGVVDAGQVGAISGTSFTASSAVLRAVSSSYSDDTLTGTSLFIYAITTGAGQRRLLTDWSSTNAVGNVDNWGITPTQTTAKYVLFATPPASSSNVPDVNVVKILSTTSPARPGYVGVDWAFVTSKAAYNDLSSTFISTNQSIAGASAPTAAQNAAAVWGEIATSYSLTASTFASILKSAATNVSTISSHTINISSRAASTDSRIAAITSLASSSDSRFAFLDGSISSRATSSDSRFVFLDGSVTSRAVAGDAMALTAAERASLAGVILTTTMAESYRASSAIGSLTQLTYEVLANLTDMSNSGTTRTLNSVTSHAAGSVQYQYDSTTPSAITRTA